MTFTATRLPSPPQSKAAICVRTMRYESRIAIDPAIRSGKPCIRGTRTTVYDVLDYLAGGMSEQEILRDFPSLTSDDLKAVLEFAAARERMKLSS